MEVTLECIRRMACENNKERPLLKISGKNKDEEKCRRLQEMFAKHDLSKPFKIE